MLSLIHTKSIVLVHPTVTCGTSSFLTIIQYLLSNYLEIYWLIMLRLVHYFMMAHFVFQLVAYRITLKIYSVLLYNTAFVATVCYCKFSLFGCLLFYFWQYYITFSWGTIEICFR